MVRHLRSTALLIVTLSAVPAAVHARGTINVPWSIVHESRTAPDGSCEASAFLQIPALRGVTAVTATLTDTVTRSRGSQHGPPYSGDHVFLTSQPVDVPSGSHRWGLSGIAQGGGNCEQAYGNFLAPSRWQRVVVKATMDDRARILGVVRSDEGAPVRGATISAAGPVSRTMRTNAAGAYGDEVRAGRYTVTARGYCAAGAPGCASSRTVRVPARGSAVVNFTARSVTLAGTVTQRVCEAGCRQPLGGVTIRAAGKEATSGEDGTWRLRVPAGPGVRVTPSAAGRVFDPASLTVDATADRTGIDFDTCGIAATRRRAPTPLTPCDPDTISWELPARLTDERAADWGRRQFGLPPASFVNATAWRVEVKLLRRGHEFACQVGYRWRWVVTPRRRGTRVVEAPEPGCSARFRVSDQARYEVRAVEQKRTGGRWVDTGTELGPETIEVRDWLILGLGDSNGSGEGNPRFFFDRCNRSIDSYQYRTAMDIESSDPHSTVTFVQSSCSGAMIEHLVDQRYEGINPEYPTMPPQVRQINTILHGGDRDPDLALVSVGVNNLAFGGVMEFCISEGTLHGRECNSRHVHPQRPNQPFRVDHFENGVAGSPTLEDFVAGALQNLPGHYADLARALSRPRADGGLALGRSDVIMAAYPDFTHDDRGETCDTTGQGAGAGTSVAALSRVTWGWIGDSGSALNATIARVSPRHGWTPTPFNPIFLTHGYCSSDSFFRGLGEALSAGNKPGAFHPTLAGHMAQEALTLPIACRRLYGARGCPAG